MKRKTGNIKRLLIMCLFALTFLWVETPITVNAATISASNETQLRNAISNAKTGEVTEITLTASFSIAAKIDVPAGRNILIISDGVERTITLASGTSTMFNLGAGSTLTLGDNGARIILIGNTSTGSSLINCGNNSTLTINNVTIKNSSSGAIGMSSTAQGVLITVNNGAIFDGNHKSQGSGGAIEAINATVVINGGLFNNNSARVMGGAISVSGETVGSITVNGGTFTNNYIPEDLVTMKEWGGGAIAIATMGEESYIRGGKFENNSASWMGGAIYVDNYALLTVTNAVITGNTASSFGGGIWYCGKGDGLYFEEYGLYNTGNTASNGSDLNLDPSPGKTLSLITTALGGGTISWYDENLKKEITTLVMNRTQTLNFKATVSGGPSVDEVKNQAKVIISNNSVRGNGGGIACNGTCTFGVADPISKTVTKSWSGKDAVPDYKVEVQLYKDGIPFDLPVELNSSNSWTHTWPDLPDDGSDYTVKEVSINGVPVSGNTHTINDGTYKGIVAISIIDDGATNEFYITNTFSDTTVKKARVVLEASKSYTNGTLVGDDFEFGLYEADSTGTITNATAIKTAKNSSAGSVTFSALEYEESDAGKTYYYVIKEIAGSDSKITYSSASSLVKVVVSLSSDGKTVETVVTYDGGSSKPSFTNLYTYSLPSIGTHARDKDSGTQTAIADSSVTIVDTVTYNNLVVGTDYKLEGILMNKATGNPLLVNGKTVTATITFKPSTANGSIALEFTFNGTGLAGTSVVVFEELYLGSNLEAYHRDINDLGQTVVLKDAPRPIPKTAVDENLTPWTLLSGIALWAVFELVKKKKYC